MVSPAFQPFLIFFKYPEIKYFYVTTEGSPLRSTPIDAGINRMAHLQRNINLLIDGEKGGFYRVILGDNQYGWIAKTNVKQFSNFEITPATMSGYDYIDSDEFFTFIFHLDKKVPFEIIENNPLLIKFFNVKDNENNIYTMDLPLDEMMDGKKLIGYSGEYQGNDFVLKIRKPLQIHTKKPLKNIKIAIDAGHQGKGNSKTEPIGPGAKMRKPKVAYGTQGVKTKVPESKLTLQIALKLEKELKKRGYDVYMIRRKQNVNISNKQRAIRANKSGADICIRLHADAASANVRGVSVLYPSQQNPYVAKLSKKSKKLSKNILDSYCKSTKFKKRGLSKRDDLTGTNWSKIPVALIEMGFMTNKTEDKQMQKKQTQKKMVDGIANGIDQYFK